MVGLDLPGGSVNQESVVELLDQVVQGWEAGVVHGKRRRPMGLHGEGLGGCGEREGDLLLVPFHGEEGEPLLCLDGQESL